MTSDASVRAAAFALGLVVGALLAVPAVAVGYVMLHRNEQKSVKRRS